MRIVCYSVWFLFTYLNEGWSFSPFRLRINVCKQSQSTLQCWKSEYARNTAITFSIFCKQELLMPSKNRKRNDKWCDLNGQRVKNWSLTWLLFFLTLYGTSNEMIFLYFHHKWRKSFCISRCITVICEENAGLDKAGWLLPDFLGHGCGSLLKWFSASSPPVAVWWGEGEADGAGRVLGGSRDREMERSCGDYWVRKWKIQVLYQPHFIF